MRDIAKSNAAAKHRDKRYLDTISDGSLGDSGVRVWLLLFFLNQISVSIRRLILYLH